MRFSSSKTWMFLAGAAVVCAIFPLSSATATGAPTTGGTGGTGVQTPAPAANVKVKGNDEATPAPITYNTIDGIWEVQLQAAGAATVYSHFNLLTSAENVSGDWDRDNVRTPLTGLQNGDHFQFNGSDAKGAFTLTGYIENSATIIGQFTQGGRNIAFTANHQGLPLNERPGKQKHSHRRHHKGEQMPIPDPAVPTPTP